MLYCYASKKAGKHANGESEFILAVERKKAIIYDWKKDVFRWAHDGTIVNLANLEEDIMPFSEGIELLITKFDIDSLTTIPPNVDLSDPKQYKDTQKLIGRTLKSYNRNSTLGHINFVKIIERHGGKCVMSSNDSKIIECWPNYYQTRRNTKVLTGKELINMSLKQLLPYVRKGDVGGMVFVKTARKNFGEYIPIKEILDPLSVFYQLVLDSAMDIDFIISEPAAIKKIQLPLPYITVSNNNEDNQKGNRYINAEYRCIVIKGEICSMSLYTDNLIHQVPEEAYNFACEVLEKMRSSVNTLKTYSFDIMQYEDDTWDVVEFHPVTALGCYLYNTLCPDLDNYNITDTDLHDQCIHKDVSKLPIRIIYDISKGNKSITVVTQYLEAKYDRSIEDHGYASAYQSMHKHGLAMAYMLLKMVDTGIQPGLESINPQVREETKKNVVGFMDSLGVDKDKIKELVNIQEQRLQLRPTNPNEIIDRARAEDARLKSRYGGNLGAELSDAWYVKEAIEMGELTKDPKQKSFK